MVRMARAVAPGAPRHVTRRGSRRQPTFLADGGCGVRLGLLAAQCGRFGPGV
jgi:putative transposase